MYSVMDQSSKYYIIVIYVYTVGYMVGFKAHYSRPTSTKKFYLFSQTETETVWISGPKYTRTLV